MVSCLVTGVCHVEYVAGLQTPSENLLLFNLGVFAVPTERHPTQSLHLPLPKLEIAGTFLAGMAKKSLHAVGTDLAASPARDHHSRENKQYVNK